MRDKPHLTLPRTASDFADGEHKATAELPQSCLLNDTAKISDCLVVGGMPVVARVLECRKKRCGLSYLHVGVHCPVTGWTRWRELVTRDACRTLGHRTME